MLYRHVFRILLLAAAMVLFTGGDAEAGPKLSNIVNNVTVSWGKFQNVLSAVSWLLGAGLGTIAVFKFKDHVDNPQQTPLSAGVKRMLAGGMFLSLPFMINAVRGSLFGNQVVGANSLKNTGFTNATLSAGGLDKMVVDVMANIGGPMEALLTAFSYLAGIALLLVGISRLTKRLEEGPRGPAGFGTIMTFIASGALFSFGDSMGSFTSTVFGDNQLLSVIVINSNVITNATDKARIEKVLEGVEVFVMIVGYIAFIRGWFVLKNYADGQQNATMAQGLTFLFGGTFAINLGELINALQNTVGVGALTFK
ncbi:MAG: hypothetical protein EPN97_01585 [Alphaproteobacteria bacterium]|nr:MAG: hypothetical protein EPN97_01585 [Alphaproteobacteria bacterium]